MSNARIRAIITALELKTVKNGATPDEAASAQAKAVELRRKYNISATEKPTYSFSSGGSSGGSTKRYQQPKWNVREPSKKPPTPEPTAQPQRPIPFPYVIKRDTGGMIGCQWFMLNIHPDKVTKILEESGYVKTGGEIARGEYSWVFTVNGEYKCWIYSYERSWEYGKFYLHGPLEVFQKLFQQVIFRA